MPLCVHASPSSRPLDYLKAVIINYGLMTVLNLLLHSLIRLRGHGHGLRRLIFQLHACIIIAFTSIIVIIRAAGAVNLSKHDSTVSVHLQHMSQHLNAAQIYEKFTWLVSHDIIGCTATQDTNATFN